MKIEMLEADLAAAEAAGAEMRAWIDREGWGCSDDCASVSRAGECDCGGKEFYERKAEILDSTTLGTGWISKEEADKLRSVTTDLKTELAVADQAYRVEIATLTKERDEAVAYAETLAQGLPDGLLPKDIELIREANAVMTDQINALRAEIDAHTETGIIVGNTGLACTKGVADAFSERTRERDEAMQSIHRIQDDVYRLAKTASDVLTPSDGPEHPSLVDVVACIKRDVPALREQASKLSLQVEIARAEIAWRDAALRETLDNLVSLYGDTRKLFLLPVIDFIREALSPAPDAPEPSAPVSNRTGINWNDFSHRGLPWTPKPEAESGNETEGK